MPLHSGADPIPSEPFQETPQSESEHVVQYTTGAAPSPAEPVLKLFEPTHNTRRHLGPTIGQTPVDHPPIFLKRLSGEVLLY